MWICTLSTGTSCSSEVVCKDTEKRSPSMLTGDTSAFTDSSRHIAYREVMAHHAGIHYSVLSGAVLRLQFGSQQDVITFC